MTNVPDSRGVIAWKVCAIALSLLSSAIGMFLPVFTGPQVATAYVNVFWGSVYGLGFLLAQSFLGEMHPGTVGVTIATFGMIIWPLIVLFGLYKTFAYLFLHQPRWVIVITLIALLATLAYNVQIGSVRGTYVERMPIFSAFMDV